MDEFERRYEAMPELKKAELIEGVVYMSSAVRFDEHADQHFNMIGWLFIYRAHTPGVQGGDNATLRLPAGMNRPQPDACLRIVHSWAGQSQTDQKGYVCGAPELVAEVTASTASYDLHDKLGAYQRNGVREYVVWRVVDRGIDWFILRGDRFRRMSPDKDHIYRSKVFPGLWLDAPALIESDLPKVLSVVQQGVQSDEHRKFVERLAEKKGKR
ncbi:MAG: Uma2 family endonuclease [Gemmataceae bacterium]|nr:Uma2 family endonuclease [Gemmataceae bacterium]